MRYLMLGFCVVFAACADTRLNTPVGPSSLVSSAASRNATNGSALPFRGDLQATETAAGTQRHLTGSGEATLLGRFTLSADFTVVPGPPVSTASGTATWTAANGDLIFTTLTGEAVITFPQAAIVETHTITGGTGRFADATGAFLMDRSLNLQTFASTASITGTINLGH